MEIIHSAKAMQALSSDWLKTEVKIGFVPTMGALHAGHMELIRRAKKECQKVIVSIYVNPLQFGLNEDFRKYPRTRSEDIAWCRAAGVDIAFVPTQLFRSDHSTYVEEIAMASGREGAMRPGHFRGVATVVLKLFLLVRPTHAYFGQKDGQQVEVVRRMVRDLSIPLQIVTVPTVRTKEGLALSSRNRYLSPEEQACAISFAQALKLAAKKKNGAVWLRKELNKVAGLKIDYIEKTGDRLYAAIQIGATRLLDNQQS